MIIIRVMALKHVILSLDVSQVHLLIATMMETHVMERNSAMLLRDNANLLIKSLVKMMKIFAMERNSAILLRDNANLLIHCNVMTVTRAMAPSTVSQK